MASEVYNYNGLTKSKESDYPKMSFIWLPFRRIAARLVVYLMALTGFVVSYMLRTDMNVAIVSMSIQPELKETSNTSCIAISRNGTAYSNSEEEFNIDGKVDWSPGVQSYVLAAFYWTYVMGQIPGAMLTQKFGPKFVYGYGQFLTAVCTIFIPVASDGHYAIVIVLRLLQGMFSGLTWPAMFALMSFWVPAPERTRFVSCLQGYNLGIGFNYPLCGYLITYFGWKSVFYTTGSIGIFWAICWYMFIFDDPDTHPRISYQERAYIKEQTRDTIGAKQSSISAVPWKKILTSMPVWAIAITGFGWIWVNYVFIIGGPMYLSNVQGFDIKQSGILSGAPFLVSFPVALIFCYMADKIIVHKLIPVTTARKIFTAAGQVVPGAMIIALGFLGCDRVPIIVIWFIAVTMPTAMYAGVMPNVTEISPSYASTVIAVVQTFFMLASFISPLVTGYLIRDGNTVAAWQNVFNISAGLSICTYLIYLFCGTSNVQSWNEPPKTTNASGTIGEQEQMLQHRNRQKIEIRQCDMSDNNIGKH